MVRREERRRAAQCRWRAGLGLLLLTSLWLGACDPYDRELLPARTCGDGRVEGDERCDTAISAGQPGACPAECPAQEECEIHVPIGSACTRECVTAMIASPRDRDSCCPTGATAVEDSDCDVCGDGVVGVHERCDPPESCPKAEECVSSVQCISLHLAGSADSCTAHCEVSLIDQCTAGDMCCPSGCDNAADSDCSNTCGDGLVESERGETCDANNPGAQCVSSCQDGDACTLDMLLGSEDNCNVSCTHMAIEHIADGDGCCPLGVRAVRDRDCTALFHPALRNRYRFDDEGSTLRDWLADGDATLVNATASGTSSVELAGGTSDQYVILPSGMLSAQESVTLEIWITLRGETGSDFERIFDFGNSEAGPGEQGIATSFFYLTPRTDAGVPRLSFAPVASQRVRVDGLQPVAREAPVHFAAVYDGSVGAIALYIDGAPVGSASVDMPLSALDDVNNWLGRSQYAQDAELGASLHEFRIYAAALSDAEIAASFTAGPDPADR